MQIWKSFKVELDPNDKQQADLLKHADAARFAWNWGLERRIAEYKETGRSSNFVEQRRQLRALKKTGPGWLYGVCKSVPQEALRDLDRAFWYFFKHRKQGERAEFPKPKSRENSIDAFRIRGSIRVTETRIWLRHIGWLPLKEHGCIPVEGVKFISATVFKVADRWFVSVACEREVEDASAADQLVGADLGICLSYRPGAESEVIECLIRNKDSKSSEPTGSSLFPAPSTPVGAFSLTLSELTGLNFILGSAHANLNESRPSGYFGCMNQDAELGKIRKNTSWQAT